MNFNLGALLKVGAAIALLSPLSAFSQVAPAQVYQAPCIYKGAKVSFTPTQALCVVSDYRSREFLTQRVIETKLCSTCDTAYTTELLFTDDGKWDWNSDRKRWKTPSPPYTYVVVNGVPYWRVDENLLVRDLPLD